MATTMLSAGIPITTVSARLSHARTSTTLNVYAHAVPGGDGFAAEVLSSVLHKARWQREPQAGGSRYEGHRTRWSSEAVTLDIFVRRSSEPHLSR